MELFQFTKNAREFKEECEKFGGTYSRINAKVSNRHLLAQTNFLPRL